MKQIVTGLMTLTIALGFAATVQTTPYMGADTELLNLKIVKAPKISEENLGLNGTSGHRVPQPATMLLFGAGLAGIAGVARRKRN